MKIYDRIQAFNPDKAPDYVTVCLWRGRSGLPFVYLEKRSKTCRVNVTGQERDQGWTAYILTRYGWVAASRKSFEKWAQERSHENRR